MTLSLFQQIIKALPRRRIAELVATHKSDKWTKQFATFDHLVVMIYAQLSGQTSLRDLEASFNASPARHYHLGATVVKRSTLSDANAARPASVFEAILARLLDGMAAKGRNHIGELIQLLDSTTLSLFAKTHKAMRFRSNNSAIKLHLLFDPDAQCPTWFQITPARLHDSRLCESLALTAGATYVFDRAYNKAEFWADIDAADASLVTRPKSNLAYDVQHSRLHPNSFIVADETIVLAGQPGRKYTKPLRRIEIFDEDRGRELAFITNDFDRSAEQIAALYKRRWQIELFFKWIKQNLKVKTFLGTTPNAVLTQLWIALCVYLLLSYLKFKAKLGISLTAILRLLQLNLFERRYLIDLLKPPDIKQPVVSPQLLLWNQL